MSFLRYISIKAWMGIAGTAGFAASTYFIVARAMDDSVSDPVTSAPASDSTALTNTDGFNAIDQIQNGFQKIELEYIEWVMIYLNSKEVQDLIDALQKTHKDNELTKNIPLAETNKTMGISDIFNNMEKFDIVNQAITECRTIKKSDKKYKQQKKLCEKIASDDVSQIIFNNYQQIKESIQKEKTADSKSTTSTINAIQNIMLAKKLNNSTQKNAMTTTFMTKLAAKLQEKNIASGTDDSSNNIKNNLADWTAKLEQLKALYKN